MTGCPVPPGEVPFLPTRRVVWGAGSVGRLQEVLEQAGVSRALVLTTGSLVRQRSLLDRVRSACGPLCAGPSGTVGAHVPLQDVRAGVQLHLDLRADAIVSFGGGSVIDAAKAMAVRLRDAGAAPVAHVAVPTTLSGAEFSHFYGVTEEGPDGPVKRSHAQVEATPTAVVLDPELTAATPARLWAGSAVKAVDHAVEALLAGAPGPVVGTLAQLGIRHMAEALPESSDTSAVDLRLRCQIAAWECYVAPAAATLGLSHRIGHVLGGTYGIPHSLTSAVTLPPVMRAMAESSPGPLAAVARALDLGAALDLSAPAGSDPLDAPALLAALLAGLGLPTRLHGLGVARSDLPQIAARVAAAHPRRVAQLGGDSIRRLGVLLEDMW